MQSDAIAALPGDHLGGALAASILDQHGSSRSEWRQEYGEEYAEYNPTKIEGEFKDVQPSKPKKPKAVCAICGETDDNYPDWEGDSEHVIRDREEAKRKSRAARERTRKSKAAAKVRREAVAESSDYTQGRSKK